MNYEQRDNSGSLFKIEPDKKVPNGPEYSGKGMIGGTMYYMSAWIKKPEGKKPYFSFSFKPVGDAPDTRTLAERRPKPPVVDDEIPF